MANKRKKNEEDTASETGTKSNSKKKNDSGKKVSKDKPNATASKAAAKASKSSAKEADTEDNTATLRRSQRRTKGEGGTAAQLKRVGEAVKHVPQKKKAAVKDIPKTSTINPMAPVTTSKHRKSAKDTATAEVPTPPADPRLDPAIPQFIVPPGTEPSLAVPALGGFYAYGHQYGFPAPPNQAANPPSSPQEQQIGQPEPEPDDNSDTAMAIDPSLLTANDRSGRSRARDAGVEHSSSGSCGNSEDADESSDNEEESGDGNGDGDEDEGGANEANSHIENDGDIWGGIGGGADDDHSEDPFADEFVGQVNVDIELEGNEDPTVNDLLPALIVDPKYAEMGWLLEMFGPKRKASTQPFKYEDSRVTDILNKGVMVDGSDSESKQLRNLLRSIKKDWMAEHPRDPTFATHESTKERTPAGAAPGYDVLQRHRSKNRVPGLSKRQRQQAKSKHKAESSKDKARRPKAKVSCSPDDATDEDDGDDSPDDGDRTRSRARRHSKKPYTRRSNNPTQLGFYPRTWQDVLGTAKMNWRVRVASEWGFPKIREQGAELLECLTQAITEYENENGSLEEGYFPKYKSEMIILVWEDTSLFRGELKKLARLVVPARYSIFPPQGEDDPQLDDTEYAQYIKDAVKALTDSGDFMHNGKDSKGQTNNLTHPAVGELCMTFYYGKNSRIGHEYEEIFGSEIPPLAVALVIAALKCSLDEWAEGTYDPVDFQADTYRSQYEEIVAAIDSVVASAKHGPKFLQARRDWAAKGITRVSAAPAAKTARFQVHLD
ncbi:hypothetical protein HWV62_15479 [Athelia sp. TMB]|nr:hypothetical protein HWV62_15479 [Athelia sp. TMB]